MNRVEVKDWGITPSRERFNVLRLSSLLNHVRESGEVTIVFEEGEYHFSPDYATEKLLYISNHDEDSIKKVAFDLTDFHNVTIQGNQTKFIFHTDILPLYLYHCSDVTIQGISIDYEKPGYSEGTIVHVEPKRMVLSIDKDKYSYFIKNNRIYFTGENYCHEIWHWLEIDVKRNAPVYEGHDMVFNHPDFLNYFKWKQKNDDEVEVILTEDDQYFYESSAPGNVVVLRHHPRNYPGIFINESKNITCEDVKIYHSTGMGVIAEFTENITLNEFQVTLHPDKKRVFTSAADATHFVYCKGLIHINNCLMENQLDDPVNVHGIYSRIKEIINDRELIVELVHHQQKGVKVGDVGDEISFVEHKSMLPYGKAVIEDIYMINKDYTYLKFNQSIENMKTMDVVENSSYIPDVLIENSTFQNNRARGLLLTSAGNVVVKNNTFRTSGAAILIEGDSNDWFESGATKHILIESNTFENCNYITDWGKAPIQVSPRASEYVEGVRYHKCLEIKNNQFYCFDERLIKAINIERIEFTNNTITRTKEYPPIEGERFSLDKVLEFVEKDNQYKE